MTRLAAGLLCVCALRATAAAHVLDEYLQVAQIALSPDGVGVELRLVPGVQVADRIFAQLDLDHDGQLAPAEQQAYAQRVLQDVALDVDGRRATLALTAAGFPSRGELADGVGAIRLTFSAPAALGTPGDHRVEFRNRHLPELGVYLANVLVPDSDHIVVTRQQRDPWQRELRVECSARRDARGWVWWAGAWSFGVCLVVLLPWRSRRFTDAAARWRARGHRPS